MHARSAKNGWHCTAWGMGFSSWPLDNWSCRELRCPISASSFSQGPSCSAHQPQHQVTMLPGVWALIWCWHLLRDTTCSRCGIDCLPSYLPQSKCGHWEADITDVSSESDTISWNICMVSSSTPPHGKFETSADMSKALHRDALPWQPSKRRIPPRLMSALKTTLTMGCQGSCRVSIKPASRRPSFLITHLSLRASSSPRHRTSYRSFGRLSQQVQSKY